MNRGESQKKRTFLNSCFWNLGISISIQSWRGLGSWWLPHQWQLPPRHQSQSRWSLWRTHSYRQVIIKLWSSTSMPRSVKVFYATTENIFKSKSFCPGGTKPNPRQWRFKPRWKSQTYPVHTNSSPSMWIFDTWKWKHFNHMDVDVAIIHRARVELKVSHLFCGSSIHWGL